MTPGGATSPRRHRLARKLALAVVATVVTLALAEVALRLSGRYRTLTAEEAANLEAPVDDGIPDYGDTWREGGLGPGGYLRENFSARVHSGLGGTVEWRNNAQGFRHGSDTSLVPPPGSLRMLSLGDSFTAGYRVDQEATFSRLLERWLQERHADHEVEVLISVIEEPATGLYYLMTQGLRFAPDLVLLGVTLGNDLSQVYLKLDPEGDYRLTGDPEHPIERNPGVNETAVVRRLEELAIPARCVSSSRPRAGKDAEPALRLLRLIGRVLARGTDRGQAVTSTWPDAFPPRLFDGNGLGFLLVDRPAEIELAFDRLAGLLRGYRDLTEASGTRLAIVLFPQRYQVQPRDWQAMIDRFALAPDCFDLQAPGRKLLELCSELGLSCFDPTAGMGNLARQKDAALYLPGGDMHWNAAGHRALFEQIRTWVESLQPDRRSSQGGLKALE